jgi:hypothetical protein
MQRPKPPKTQGTRQRTSSSITCWINFLKTVMKVLYCNHLTTYNSVLIVRISYSVAIRLLLHYLAMLKDLYERYCTVHGYLYALSGENKGCIIVISKSCDVLVVAFLSDSSQSSSHSMESSHEEDSEAARRVPPCAFMGASSLSRSGFRIVE